MKRHVLVAVAAAALLGVAVVPSTTGCVGGNPEGLYQFPDEGAFVSKGVSAFMEKRCGSMDCHGNVARPLRLYSQYGLRLEAADVRGPTTAAEQKANYLSVTGLEPEELTTAVASKGAYTDFMLLKKPVGEEGFGVKHKGGPVLRALPSDPGWSCLLGWVRGDADAAICDQATKALD